MIPDAAVEAAAEALCRAVWNTTWAMVNENQRHVFRTDARAALEAAAPHMESERVEALKHDLSRAQVAARKAYTAGHLDGMNGSPNANPYRSQA